MKIFFFCILEDVDGVEEQFRMSVSIECCVVTSTASDDVIQPLHAKQSATDTVALVDFSFLDFFFDNFIILLRHRVYPLTFRVDASRQAITYRIIGDQLINPYLLHSRI